MLGDKITFGDGLIVTVFSMAIVFLSLLVISFIIDALRAVATKDSGEKVVEKTAPIEVSKEVVKEEIVDTSNDEDEGELVAVIAAAIAASMGINVSDLNINSIKRVPQTGPVWSKVGRQEQIFNRL